MDNVEFVWEFRVPSRRMTLTLADVKLSIGLKLS
jgi:hypothetical protein